MKTTQVVMPHVGGPEVLELQERELPEPGPGQVRIKVEATGVAFAEVQMLRGRYYAQPKFPFVPGYDLVGRIEAVGPGVGNVRAEERSDEAGRRRHPEPRGSGASASQQSPGVSASGRVATMTRTGAWSERVVVPATHLVPVPDDLDAGEVVALITNGVTAYQMIHRVAKVAAGQTVLVHGAAGGVGTLLVRLALRAGARVIGTASPGKHEQVRAMGATPLDYRDQRLVERVREIAPGGVAAVFDHAGGPGLKRSWSVLGRGGVLIVYGSAANVDDKGWRLAPFVSTFSRLVWWSLPPNGGRRGRFYSINHKNHFDEDLAKVIDLLRTGELRPHVATRLPLAEASKALRMLDDRTVVGKIVLEV